MSILLLSNEPWGGGKRKELFVRPPLENDAASSISIKFKKQLSISEGPLGGGAPQP